MDKRAKNNLRRAVMIPLYVLGKSLATIGMWGAIGWMCLREIFTPEIPFLLRIVPALCGLAALPLYPFFLLGCWMVRVSEIETKYPFWDLDETTDGPH